MLITLSHAVRAGNIDHDATALGYLLYKHPAKLQSFDVAAGVAHVFYPTSTPERTTVAVLLELDPIELARSKGFTGDAFALAHYVNDRPYTSGSMMAVALGKVFRTAMAGRSDVFPDLAQQPIPLEITVASLPARGGPELVRALFEPLGWTVDAREIALDLERPEWGSSRYVDLTLAGSVRLADALRHLYVLLPVLDDAKHYWVSDAEVDKLMRAGEGWLSEHPQRDVIMRRYLRHHKGIVADATARLVADPEDASAPDGEALEGIVRSPRLADARADAVLAALRDVRAHRVVDLGCGEGALVSRLVADATFSEIIGTDVSARELQRAAQRLDLRNAPDRVRARVQLLQSSVTYQDDRTAGMDAAVLMEVIEHIDLERLPAMERAVWGLARPAAVIVTTPNADYNGLFPELPAGHRRHSDHRFEWTRAQFQSWAHAVAESYGYEVEFRPVGPEDAVAGSATQLALFIERSAV